MRVSTERMVGEQGPVTALNRVIAVVFRRRLR